MVQDVLMLMLVLAHSYTVPSHKLGGRVISLSKVKGSLLLFS